MPTEVMHEAAETNLDAASLEKLAGLFRVLAEPARLALLQEIKHGERSVNALVEATGLGQASVSKHLKTLHDAGLVARRRAGTKVYYRVAAELVFSLCRMVCENLRQDGRSGGPAGS